MRKRHRYRPSGRAAALAALLVLVGGSAACRAPRASPGELTFVTWKPNQPAVWDRAVAMFEKAHPGITVRRQVGPHSSTAFHDLLAQKLKNRDTTMDVFFMDVIWPAEFAAAGWTRPLDDLFPPAERARFLPGTIAANTWRGHIYGVPAFVDVGLLYYRKDLLDAYGFAPPDTWDALARQATRIVAGERRDTPGLVGYVGQFKQYEGLVCNMLELVASNGGRFVDRAGRRAELASKPDLEAVRWVRRSLVGSVAPRSVLTYEEPESLSVFLQGQAVFLRTWPYAWEVANNPGRSRVVGRVGVTALPHFPGHTSAAALGGWQYAINAASTHRREAWTFIAFMTSPAMQRYFAVEASLAPTRAALFDDPEVLARNPQFADQAEAFRLAVPRPVTPVYPAVSAVLQRTFSTVLAEPDAALEAEARAADAAIDRLLAMVPPGP